MLDEDKGQVAASSDAQKAQPVPEPAVDEKAEKSAAKPEEKPADIKALQQELEKQTELSKHHLDQWKRTAAGLENYRRRAEKEREELLRFGDAVLITKLLPVLDDFERAFQTVPATLSDFTWIEGVALIERKLRLLLEQQGLREVDALGKPFDPKFHQAVLQEESTAYPDGYIVAVLQKGYTLHDRVLRPAMVKVARNEQGGKTVGSAEAEGNAPATDKEKEDESRTE